MLKDSDTRNKIDKERGILLQTDISKMKQYLIKKKIIKIGTTCPNEIIKKMYEDSILSGDVDNKSFDTLLHNFKKKLNYIIPIYKCNYGVSYNEKK